MDPVETAGQLIRALRGSRSQRAFARRIGYRGNPIANWEAGLSAPAGPWVAKVRARPAMPPAAVRELGIRRAAPRPPPLAETY